MCLNLLFFGTFPLRITIAESADLGNPNHSERKRTDNLKILVIDNIFVLGKNS